MFCARDALLGAGGESEEEDSSFMLVLGDHLYRRGAGTTYACAGQLIHAFLEHGEAGKPAIGLKVRVQIKKIASSVPCFVSAQRRKRFAPPARRLCLPRAV